ncbi:Bestrophin, RFP-TM, chloride channel-domain-containing protein [Zopfochytrium polystomum]|nr:Bestrophin, RFP-TM, chloride channel-domain-containing protein [Zopfochytrium polystomum]
MSAEFEAHSPSPSPMLAKSSLDPLTRSPPKKSPSYPHQQQQQHQQRSWRNSRIGGFLFGAAGSGSSGTEASKSHSHRHSRAGQVELVDVVDAVDVVDTPALTKSSSSPYVPASTPPLAYPVGGVGGGGESDPRGSFDSPSPEELRFRSFSEKLKNKASEHWRDILRIDASVIPSVFMPTLTLTAWSALVTVFYMVPSVNFLSGRIPNSTLLVTVLGVVMGLLLVFRTNTSYDRFWEGRRIWSVVQTNVRNLARFIWVCAVAKDAEGEKLKRGAMNLVIAFAVACKNYLRSEFSYRNNDLGRLIRHLPEYSSTSQSSTSNSSPGNINIPLDLTFHLQSFVNHCRRADMIDVPVQGNMTTCISALVDSLTAFERIRSSPIPFAYSIHLKQTLLVYLLSLPFQIVPSIFWATIPSVFIASFTLLGIEAIGGEIENPFGFDPNDLPQDLYTDDIRNEIFMIMGEQFKYDSTTWIEPYRDITKSHLDLSHDPVPSVMPTPPAPAASTETWMTAKKGL